MGAPLEDARHLAQRYDRMRQEAEAQVIYMRHNRFTFTFCLCIYPLTINTSTVTFISGTKQIFTLTLTQIYMVNTLHFSFLTD